MYIDEIRCKLEILGEYINKRLKEIELCDNINDKKRQKEELYRSEEFRCFNELSVLYTNENIYAHNQAIMNIKLHPKYQKDYIKEARIQFLNLASVCPKLTAKQIANFAKDRTDWNFNLAHSLGASGVRFDKTIEYLRKKGCFNYSEEGRVILTERGVSYLKYLENERLGRK